MKKRALSLLLTLCMLLSMFPAISVTAGGHTHEWSYEVSEDKTTITATCKNKDCTATDTSLTIVKPLRTTYDGKSHAAYFTGSDGKTATSFCGDALPAITYQLKGEDENYGEATDSAPTETGTYKASATIPCGGSTETISVEFSIDSPELTAEAEKTATWQENSFPTKASVELRVSSEMEEYVPKVLFIGTLCNNHGLQEETLETAINAAAQFADVTYYALGKKDGFQLTKYNGTLFKGEKLTDEDKFTLIQSGHYCYTEFIDTLYTELIENTNEYDNIILSFDSGYLGYRSKKNKNASAVATALLPYYKSNRMIWMCNSYNYTYDSKSKKYVKGGLDPYAFANTSPNNFIISPTNANPFELAVEYFRSLMVLVDPESYLDVEKTNSWESWLNSLPSERVQGDVIYLNDINSYPGATEGNYKISYDDASKVGDFIAELIQPTYTMSITESIADGITASNAVLKTSADGGETWTDVTEVTPVISETDNTISVTLNKLSGKNLYKLCYDIDVESTFNSDNLPEKSVGKSAITLKSTSLPDTSTLEVDAKLLFHNHAWEYSVSEDKTTLIATCTCKDNDDQCSYKDKTGADRQVSVSIVKPTLTEYGLTGEGISEKATLSGTTLGGLTLSVDDIKYYKKTDGNYGDALLAAPTDAGDYKAEITVNDGTKDYTASVEYTIAKAKVAVPTANTGLTYGGNEQTGVADPATDAKYTVSDNKKTNAGDYTAKAVLTDKTNYAWNLTTPTSDDQEIPWSIAKAKVAVPTANTGLTYNGNAQTGVDDPATGAKYTVSDNKKTNAGDYTAKAVLSDKTNYAWDLTTPTNDDQEIPWSIARADLKVADFNFAPPETTDRIYSGTAKKAKVETSLKGVGTVTVRYFSDDDRQTSATPTDAGTYYVGISVTEGTNYNAADLLFGSGWKFEIARATQTIAAPTAKTENIGCYSITLDASATGQGDTCYAISTENTKPAVDSSTWQTGTEFTGLSMDTTYYFFAKYAGNNNYEPIVSEGTEIKTLNHYHEKWSFILTEGTKDTVEAHCGGPGGDEACKSFDSSLVRSIQLIPDAKTVTYDGQAHGAALNQNSLAEIANLPEVMYQLKTGEDTYGEPTKEKPTDVGNYKATVTFTHGENNEKSTMAEVEFTITPADITDISVEQDDKLTYNGKKQTATVKAEAKTVNSQIATFTYCAEKDGTYTDEVPAFTDAYNYTVYYKVTAPNHNESTGNFTVTIVKFEENAITGTLTCPEVMEDFSPCPGGVAVQFGEIRYLYSSDGTNWDTWEKTYTGVGEYQVKAVVDGNDNYNGDESDPVPFTVKPKLKISISGDDTARHTDVKSYTITLEGDRPAATTIVWDITGGNYEYVGDHIGTNSVSIICEDVGTLHIHAVLVDYEGKPVVNTSGEIVEATKDVNVKADSGNILNMIASFFRKIFGWLFG